MGCRVFVNDITRFLMKSKVAGILRDECSITLIFSKISLQRVLSYILKDIDTRLPTMEFNGMRVSL